MCVYIHTYKLIYAIGADDGLTTCPGISFSPERRRVRRCFSNSA